MLVTDFGTISKAGVLVMLKNRPLCCLQRPDLEMYGMLVRALDQIHWALPASVNLVLNIACLREVLPYYITPKALMLSEYAQPGGRGSAWQKTPTVIQASQVAEGTRGRNTNIDLEHSRTR